MIGRTDIIIATLVAYRTSLGVTSDMGRMIHHERTAETDREDRPTEVLSRAAETEEIELIGDVENLTDEDELADEIESDDDTALEGEEFGAAADEAEAEPVAEDEYTGGALTMRLGLACGRWALIPLLNKEKGCPGP
ncbi:MAG: hypothetical protein U0792_21670 [Gemmataceae bacterium]